RLPTSVSAPCLSTLVQQLDPHIAEVELRPLGLQCDGAAVERLPIAANVALEVVERVDDGTVDRVLGRFTALNGQFEDVPALLVIELLWRESFVVAGRGANAFHRTALRKDFLAVLHRVGPLCPGLVDQHEDVAGDPISRPSLTADLKLE